ncbi:hypothetical protein M3Y95_00034200 [Aphelenchoides besseyi]|nr:hypothetical protein M3Y95_00034200 [Aphelenchoides besseyi]
MGTPIISRDEMMMDPMLSNGNGTTFSSTLRRSLRQMNPFRTRLFRLPATPRLARARKVLSRGEESTNWNFERPLSTCGSVSVGRYGGAKMFASTVVPNTNGSTENSTSSIVSTPEQTAKTNSPASMTVPHLRQAPDLMSGSCRIRNPHSRPPLPCYNPPNAKEAEKMIHEHMKNLLVSPRPLQRQFLFLPDTSYSQNGEVYDANWRPRNVRSRNDAAPHSPTHSTISLLNVSRPAMRSMSYNSRDEPSQHRPQYHLNGLVHQPSLRSLAPAAETVTQLTDQSITTSTTPLLFGLHDFAAAENSEWMIFLGREWTFKELHQIVIVEQNPVTLIRGASGTGKTAILKQLALHSPFYANDSNADTVDSGIAMSTSGLPDSTLSSRNYEWLRGLAKRVVAYHECHLYAPNTCIIPEFVRNIATHLLSSPILRSYANIVQNDPQLRELIRNDQSGLDMSPVELFRLLIVEPLKRLEQEKPTQTECIIFVVDAVDEAEFHRNENGESIAWLLKTCHTELPSWVRWILSASAENLPFTGTEGRSIWIDDLDLDERIVRDMRLLVDYRIAVNPRLCQRFNSAIPNFVDEIIHRSKGNALYILRLLDMIEQDRIQLRATSPSLLPSDLSQLYLLHFNSVFSSLQQFHVASTVFSVILASLRPLSFEQLYKILNAAHTETCISTKEVERRLTLIQPFLVKLNSGAYVQVHNSLREFLLHGSGHTDYLVNVRYGHILHALHLIQQDEITTDGLFELGHHLLKANPHKYMPIEMAPEMPRTRDAQILWIQKAAGSKLQSALLFERNVFYPNNKVTRLLLMAGASANAHWPNGDSLIHRYARAGNNVLIQLLLQYGANVNEVNQLTSLTPLMEAVIHKNEETVRFLIECNANTSIRDSNGKTALVHAATVECVSMFVSIFETEPLESEGKADKSESNDRAAEVRLTFDQAVQCGNIELCRYILDKTDVVVDLNNAILIACCSGKQSTIQFLCSRGAKITYDQKCQEGKSALICAVHSGSWDIVLSVLNNSQTDINTDTTVEGWTPLMVASINGHVGLIDLLLNRGAFIDAKDKNASTAVFHAIINEHFSIATLLIDRNCNIHVTDSHGNTLLHHLALHFNKNLVERLLEMGLQVDAKNFDGLRPVELALTGDKQNAVDAFLRRGARLRSVTWQIAAENKPNYVVLLIKKLFEDGRTLYRRNQIDEAMHRFHHALEKCSEIMNDDESKSFVSERAIGNISSVRPQLRMRRCELLYTLADIQRQNAAYEEALRLSSEALRYADNESTVFQLQFFRAKCFFDNHDVENARNVAQIALSLRPENADVQVMLAALTRPTQLKT